MRAAFILAFLLGAVPATAQSVVGAIGELLNESILPGGYSAGAELRTFLRTETWRQYRARVADTTAMNTIYDLAYIRTGAHPKRAIFAAALAVLDHRTIPIKFLFGVRIDLPLTLETEENFERRVANLPEHVYADTISDRDKLQHFFFSAYFNRILGMNWATNALGTLTEIGEDLFVIGGVNDPRDRHANADGARFGKLAGGSQPSRSLTPNP